MMKFLIAPDSFKGSLTAKQAAEAIKSGLQRVYPAAEYVLVPMADGGEGTVQSLVDATAGKMLTATVHDPLGNTVTAEYGLLGDTKTAVIEMAAASGIQYVNQATANPLVTSTYGTGELILAALNQGVEQIIIGIGGSATVDGGAGMAQALGVRLLDQDDRPIAAGGAGLASLVRIDVANLDQRLHQVKIMIASDVTNPLTGPQGAAPVFGPQKGATPAMVDQLDRNLGHYAKVVKRDCQLDLATTPGAGAAGGLGFGLLAFTKATMQRGVEIVTKYSHLKERAVGSDYVFTGEGQIDFQTKFGKTPAGVATAVKTVAPTAPVIGLAGRLGSGAASLCEDDLFTAVFAITNGAKPLSQAIRDTKADLAMTAENIARVIKAK